MKIKLAALLLLIAPPAQAGPIHWLKTHKRVLLEGSAVVGASILQWKGTTYCQRGDVERCNEGYGSRRGFNYFSIGASATMFAVAQKCHKDDGGKVCYGLAFGVPAYQSYAGIHDFLNYKPKEKRE